MRRVMLGLRLLRQPRRLMGLLAGPKVLVTSVPKAGTNMLRHTLSLFPQLTVVGTPVLLPVEEQLDRIATLGPGRVIPTHLAPGPALDAVLERQDIKVVFISRDPRDVCVSLFHYIRREPGHYFHAFYSTLDDDHTLLMMTITGHEGELPDGTKVHLPSVETRFRDRLGWLVHPRCCAVTFEELVGPQGGGDGARQRDAVRRIAQHLEVHLTARDFNTITSHIFSRETPTFRRGEISAWRQDMTGEHISAFKETAGQLLIDLGYETGLDW